MEFSAAPEIRGGLASLRCEPFFGVDRPGSVQIGHSDLLFDCVSFFCLLLSCVSRKDIIT